MAIIYICIYPNINAIITVLFLYIQCTNANKKTLLFCPVLFVYLVVWQYEIQGIKKVFATDRRFTLINDLEAEG